ncbi:MAG: ATP-binding protein [Spirochaetaceae bacterium]|jgi:signal transduction histidine kinase|nr:ATP-binding protein [Spirochaetaceae bacterium]
MNRYSLKWKIIILFMLLFVGANSISFVMVKNLIKGRYDQYLISSDRNHAEMIAEMLYRGGGEELFLPGESLMPPENQNRRGITMGRMPMNMRSMDHHWSMPGMLRNPFEGYMAPRMMIILNPQGDVLFSTDKADPQHQNLELDLGIPIGSDDNPRGYVFVGTMIQRELSPRDQAFLRSLNRGFVISSLFFSLVGILLGLFLINRLFSPLEKIHRATDQLALGNWNTRTGLKGRDEIAQLGRSFDNMAQAVQQAQQWKEQIIADTAHELRTPAALIQGSLEMLKDGIYQPDVQRLESLHREAEHLSRLITDLQTLSSLESPSMELHLQPMDLAGFFEDLKDSMKDVLQAKELKLILNLPDELPAFLGDRLRLQQLFRNLLNNAQRHSPQKGEIVITLRLNRNPSIDNTPALLEISLEDAGPGIPQELQEKVFERFYRVDAARRRSDGGRGLGLAICKAITELHGGTISAGISSMGGAKISLQLPLLSA